MKTACRRRLVLVFVLLLTNLLLLAATHVLTSAAEAPADTADIQTGRGTYSHLAYVTFARAFASTPTILVNASKYSQPIIAGAANISEDGFNVVLIDDEGSSVNNAYVGWIAIATSDIAPTQLVQAGVIKAGDGDWLNFPKLFDKKAPVIITNAQGDGVKISSGMACAWSYWGFIVSIVDDDGTPVDDAWVQWLAVGSGTPDPYVTFQHDVVCQTSDPSIDFPSAFPGTPAILTSAEDANRAFISCAIGNSATGFWMGISDHANYGVYGAQLQYVAVHVGTPPPVDVLISAIKTSPATPQLQDMKVEATVYNGGLQDQPVVEVRLDVDGNQVGVDQTIDLAAQENKVVEFDWKPTSVGWHRLDVMVDPDNHIPEDLEDNSIAELVEVKAPDLEIVSLTVNSSDGGVNLVAQVKNNGTYASIPCEVRFYGSDPGINPSASGSLGNGSLNALEPYETGEATFTWSDPEAITSLHAWADVTCVVLESNEENNKYQVSLGSEPSVEAVKPHFKETLVETDTLVVLANATTIIDYVAEVIPQSKLVGIKSVEFTLTKPGGSQEPPHTDTDGSDGWSWPRHFQNYSGGDYTMTAKATDDLNRSSAASPSYSIKVVSPPKWFLDIGLGDNSPVKATISDGGVLCYTISTSGWDFYNQDDGGKGSKQLQGCDGKTGMDLRGEVTFEMCTDGNCTLWGNTSANGELKVVGWKAKFSTAIGISGSADLHTLKLGGGEISGKLEATISHLWGIVIPVINYKTGVNVSASPKLDIDYTFESKEDGSLHTKNLLVTLSCKLEGEFVVGVVDGDWAWCGAGFAGGAWITPSFTGQTHRPPPLSIGLTAGLMGKLNVFGLKSDESWTLCDWSWELGDLSYAPALLADMTVEDPQRMAVGGQQHTAVAAVEGQRPRYGSAEPTGTNSILRSSTTYDSSPYATYDFAHTPYAIWISDTTNPETTEVMVSHSLARTLWTSFRLTNNDSPELTPVLAFSNESNKGLAVYVRDEAALDRDSTLADIKASYDNTDLYYRILEEGSWRYERALTDDNVADVLPDIVANPKKGSDEIMVVWERDTQGSFDTRADRDIYYAIWDGSAMDWTTGPSPAVELEERDAEPAVAMDDQGNAILVWTHDEDSSDGSLVNQPPHIIGLRAWPNPAQIGDQVLIQAEVEEDLLIGEVWSGVQYANGSSKEFSMFYNPDSSSYECTLLADQEGAYDLQVWAADVAGLTHSAKMAFAAGADYLLPVLDALVTSRNRVHRDDTITVSVTSPDYMGTETVDVEAWLEPGDYPIFLEDEDGDGVFTGILVASEDIAPRDYKLVVRVYKSYNYLVWWNQISTFITVLGPVDTEIYCSWLPAGRSKWTRPFCITDRFDYRASQSPDVVFDSQGNAVIVWEERDELGSCTLYHVMLSKSGGPTMMPRELGKTRYGNAGPVLATTNNGYAIVGWYSDDNNRDWPEIYWAVINADQSINHPNRDVYEYPISNWSDRGRMSFNDVVDWQPSLAVDPKGNEVTMVWLAHETVISGTPGQPGFEIVQDDDDLYYETFGFPFAEAEANRVTRFADGSREQTLVFVGGDEHAVTIEVPESTWIDWDARVELTGLPNTIGQYPTDVQIFLGADPVPELVLSTLTNTQTYYLAATDRWESMEECIPSMPINGVDSIDSRDGQIDGQIGVLLRISSASPGSILLRELNIGYEFEPHQRISPNSTDNHPPDLESIENIVVREGERVRFQVRADDEDGDDLVYAINDPRFSQQHDTFTWWTEEGDEGVYTADVSVDDCSYIVTAPVTITVLDANSPPNIERIDDIVVDAGELVEITVFADDVDEDALVYGIDDPRFEQDVNRFTWQTGYEDAQVSTVVTVTASDGVYEDSQEVSIIVK